MENLKETSCTEFTELLASTSPAPGGGGASALVGAIGIALGDMVGEFTVGKAKYADVEPEIKYLMKRSQEIRVRLLELIDEDAQNFIPLNEAYKLPKDAPGREEKLEECLKLAVKAPVEIMDLCYESMCILCEFRDKGSKMLVSDAHTGLAFAMAAVEGAAINIKVNTKLMKDRAYAEEVEDHMNAILMKIRR